jgi:hypothetical protein
MHALHGLFVQTITVVGLENLQVAGHLAQWFLKVVRGDIGELLEFGVGPGQAIKPAPA